VTSRILLTLCTLLVTSIAAGAEPAAASAKAGAAYEVYAIKVATIEKLPAAVIFHDAKGRTAADADVMFWLIRNAERTVLFDAGFYREEWVQTKAFSITNFLKPDAALLEAGVRADDVTDVIISHIHWDHMQGASLFPKAKLWIQKHESEYDLGQAWQGEKDPHTGGVDARDALFLLQANIDGRVRLIDGDGVEIMPGLTVYTGSMHTQAAQYLLVRSSTPVVLASDSAYMYENVADEAPIGVAYDFDKNRDAIKRMKSIAGGERNVVPGHDPAVFTRYPTTGRVAKIR